MSMRTRRHRQSRRGTGIRRAPAQARGHCPQDSHPSPPDSQSSRSLGLLISVRACVRVRELTVAIVDPGGMADHSLCNHCSHSVFTDARTVGLAPLRAEVQGPNGSRDGRRLSTAGRFPAGRLLWRFFSDQAPRFHKAAMPFLLAPPHGLPCRHVLQSRSRCLHGDDTPAGERPKRGPAQQLGSGFRCTPDHRLPLFGTTRHRLMHVKECRSRFSLSDWQESSRHAAKRCQAVSARGAWRQNSWSETN